MPLLALLAGRTGSFSCASLRWRLDAKPRPPCPARQDLPSALREEEAQGERAKANRAKVLDAHQRCAWRDAPTCGAKLNVRHRLVTHPSGTIPGSGSSAIATAMRGAVQRDAGEPRRRCDPRPRPRRGGQRHRRLILKLTVFRRSSASAPKPSLPRCPGWSRQSSNAAYGAAKASGQRRPVPCDRRRGGNRHLVPGLGRRQSDQARFPSRDPYVMVDEAISSAPTRRLGTACGRSMARHAAADASI